MERKELLVTVLIGVLLITTAMQTVALVGLNRGQTSVVSSTPSASSPSSSAGSSQPSSSLSNLQGMVGGC